MNPQRTIQREAEVRGRGLFTGGPVQLRFKPGPPGSGITFVRCDQPQPVQIKAEIENLSKRARRTSLRNGSVTIETVEHCLAAVRGLAIDNLVIELDNAELPSGDGSAQPFVDALVDAGIEEQGTPRQHYDISDVVRVTEGDAELVAWPGVPGQLDIFYELDYGADGPVGRQTHKVTLSEQSFLDEIAPARTFVTGPEAEQLRSAGLGTHLTYQDILVFGPEGPIDNALRFPDECVRHKILDLIGDMMLLGRFACGRIHARKSGHSLNHELVKRLIEQRSADDLFQQLRRPPSLDINSVRRILPHRYPMLMIDRVIHIEGDRRAVGIKNVSVNEPYFQGHYPRQPIMPGVLIIEAMAQLGGILLSQKLEHTGKIAVLLSLDRVKFRRPIAPGDQLVIEARNKRVRARSGEVACKAEVAGELAAEAEIRFVLVDAAEQTN